MAIQLNTDLLVELGFGDLTEGQGRELLKEIYEALEIVVGVRLSDSMSDEQFDAFTAFYEVRDDAGAVAWLERNIPDYRAIVNEEFEQLKNGLREIARSAHEPPGDPAPGAAKASE